MVLSLAEFYKLSIDKYIIKNVITIDSKQSVHQAIELMSKNNVGSLIVKYGNSHYGILSERDVIREYAMELYDFHEKAVGEIMTVSPIVIDINATVGRAYELMDENNIRHLPVENDGKICGILSMRDLAHILVKKLPAKKASLKTAAKKRKSQTRKTKV